MAQRGRERENERASLSFLSFFPFFCTHLSLIHFEVLPHLKKSYIYISITSSMQVKEVNGFLNNHRTQCISSCTMHSSRKRPSCLRILTAQKDRNNKYSHAQKKRSKKEKMPVLNKMETSSMRHKH